MKRHERIFLAETNNMRGIVSSMQLHTSEQETSTFAIDWRRNGQSIDVLCIPVGGFPCANLLRAAPLDCHALRSSREPVKLATRERDACVMYSARGPSNRRACAHSELFSRSFSPPTGQPPQNLMCGKGNHACYAGLWNPFQCTHNDCTKSSSVMLHALHVIPCYYSSFLCWAYSEAQTVSQVIYK